MDSFGIGRTDIGKMREQNEDALYIDNDMGLYIVSDGMGGHAAGEEASRLAIDATVHSIKDERATINRVRQGLEDAKAIIPIVQEAVEEASRSVYEAARARPELAGMGSTLTLLLTLGRWAVMAHVGDTRLYLLRSGNVTQLSSDHTMVAELQRGGALSAEEAENSQLRNVLTRAIGSQETVLVETLLLDVLPDDRYLLCSDGLSQYADSSTLSQYLGGDLEEMPDELIAFANASGGSDNTTVVVLSIQAEDAEQADVSAVVGDLQVKFATLQSVFLFDGLSLAQLQRLLNICEVKDFVAGSTIARQGGPCAGMYVVLEGNACLLNDEAVIAQLASGDCVGDTSLSTERSCRSTLRADEPTTMLLIERIRFASLVQRRPWFGLELLARLAKRSEEAVDRLHRKLRSGDEVAAVVELELTELF